jgi:hypothetical protein
MATAASGDIPSHEGVDDVAMAMWWHRHGCNNMAQARDTICPTVLNRQSRSGISAMPEYVTTTISKNGIECVATRMPTTMDEAGEGVTWSNRGRGKNLLISPSLKVVAIFRGKPLKRPIPINEAEPTIDPIQLGNKFTHIHEESLNQL